MSASNDAVRNLLSAASESAGRREARAAWARQTAAALREAQREMDERLMEAVVHLSEEEFNRLFEEEQAKVDLFLNPLRAAAERDLWPREMYFKCI
jgi:hypothetical protein